MPPPRQGDLFAGDPTAAAPALTAAGAPPGAPPLLRHQLLAWQERLARHQQPLFAAAAAGREAGGLGNGLSQGQLFDVPAEARAAHTLDPLALAPQSLSFWRWPGGQHNGPAIYLVLDRPAHAPSPLLLYVGETGRADRRWKGTHDCKSYLAAYGEALLAAELVPQLSIRFWCDVPAVIRQRRALEQELIRHWLPPFNKETRQRWSTPFTAEID
ncbi:MAG: GIY-YIG nuclease family protein [Synechococcus sp.]|nr:GIY-YIG nuclease family protein [Synechococcus sp.]